MNTNPDFEQRLTTALTTYADRAPVEVDAVTLTSVIAHGRAHRRWSLPGRAGVVRRPDLRVALLLIVLGLAVAVGAIVVGGLRSQPRPVGVMTVGRMSHTATLLTDGRLLVAGGFATAVVSLTSAEFYDPQSGTFSPTGSMTTARGDQTAAPLSDGRVLVIGGFEVGPGELPLASAEIFDPKSGTFRPTGSMATVRARYTATLLSDGRVLIAGGKSDPAELASAELFDPRSGTFSPTGSMATAREGHTATLLADGLVLVTGGQGETTGLASAELYDPKSGTFSPTGPMSDRRALPTATLLADGRVLVAGGIDTFAVGGLPVASAELYDPKTRTFSRTGSMAAARVGYTATLLADGRVLVAGGQSSGNQTAPAAILALAELFDPKTGTFSPTGSMATARGAHTATLLSDSRVLVTGGIEVITGSGPGPALATVELYDPTTGTFSAIGP
jgi:Galactose oxidase, central domain/Kelch motif